MKKNSKKKINMLPIIILLAIIAVIIIVLVLTVGREDNNNSDVNKTELDYVKSVINKYNELQENGIPEVTMKEEGNDIVLVITELIEENDGSKHMSMINYTTKEISSIIYDKANNPVMVANMKVDENYNVSNVVTYVYATGDINSFQGDDEEIVKFKNIAAGVSTKFKEVLKENTVVLFDKTLEDLKGTKYDK